MEERLLQVKASFRSRQSFWSCVTTWFLGCRQLFGRDIVFPCRDNALLLCRDDVMIKVSMSGSRWPRQEVKCCTLHVVTSLALARVSLSRQSISNRDKVWSRPRVSMPRQRIFMLRQSFTLDGVFMSRYSLA